MVPHQEADGDNLGKSFLSSTQKWYEGSSISS